METVSADEVHRLLDGADLVGALRDMFRDGCCAPARHHHTIKMAGEPDATLLLMPAWRAGAWLGVKIATVYPGNGERGLPGVMASYLLMDAGTGAPVALIDGGALTLRRTAAASALAASYLARADAATLLMVGTGALAPHLVRAHAAARPIRRVMIWGRRAERAKETAGALADLPGAVEPVAELAEAAAEADIISCATMATEPLIRGAWLRPGVHLDLVGAYTPTMREADDEVVRRASIYVDTRAGALAEGGDIAQPLAAGIISGEDVVGDLAELARGDAPGRTDDGQITLFKSVGASLEDLAGAIAVWDQLGGGARGQH